MSNPQTVLITEKEVQLVLEIGNVINQVGRILTKTPVAGALAIDANYVTRGEIVIVPLVEDTILTISGGYDGLTFLIRGDQDAVGGHTLTLFTGFTYTKYIPTPEVLSVAAPNTYWTYAVQKNGSTFHVMASNGNLT